MTRFLGAFEYHLDDRNRVQLPPKIREAFSEGAILVKGGEECIEVYTHDGFEVLTDVVDKAPRLSSGSESLNRAVFSTAREIPRDRQGRISIPQELLQHIGLVNDEVKKNRNQTIRCNSRSWLEAGNMGQGYLATKRGRSSAGSNRSTRKTSTR